MNRRALVGWITVGVAAMAGGDIVEGELARLGPWVWLSLLTTSAKLLLLLLVLAAWRAPLPEPLHSAMGLAVASAALGVLVSSAWYTVLREGGAQLAAPAFAAAPALVLVIQAVRGRHTAPFRVGVALVLVACAVILGLTEPAKSPSVAPRAPDEGGTP